MSEGKIMLGMYRKNATIQRKKNKISNLDFDILIYTSEHEWVTQYMLLRDVTTSKQSVKISLRYLVDQGYLKIIQESKPGIHGIRRKYAITPKTRRIVVDFHEMFSYTNV